MAYIALHSKGFEDKNLSLYRQVLHHLAERHVTLAISAPLSRYLRDQWAECPAHVVFEDFPDISEADFLLSLGGDGTLLESLTLVRDAGVPILGINFGRLGFLATTPKDRIAEGIDALFNGQYVLDRRSLIRFEADRDVFGQLDFGLNEFTILKRDTSSMINVHTYINGEYLNTYWADGLIVATPTGSTGYSLSVGGPVVVPDSETFIISPVSPHNLNMRPLIVSDDSVITFEVEGRNNTFLVSLDSRSYAVEEGIRMSVRKAAFKAALVQLKGDTFFQTLKHKLNWGLDTRN